MNIANRTPATGVYVPPTEAAEVRAPRLIVRGRPTSDGAGVKLTRVIGAQLPLWIDGRRGLPGVAGLRVTIACAGAQTEVRLVHESGAAIDLDEPLVVALASNTVGRFAATALPGETEIAAAELPLLVRDAVADWLRERGGQLAPAEFSGRWQLPKADASCAIPAR